MFTEISLTIPSENVSTVTWIASQPPDIIAECLSISEASWKALQRELSTGESSKIRQLLVEAQNELREADQMKQDALVKQADKLQGDATLEIQLLMQRHDEVLAKQQHEYFLSEEEFKRRLNATEKLRMDIENNFMDERNELSRSHEAQISRMKESGDAARTNLQQRIDSLLDEMRSCRANEAETRQFLKEEFQEQLQQIRASYDTQLKEHAAMRSQMKTQNGKEIDEEYQRHLKEKHEICRDYTLQLTALREDMIICKQVCHKDKEDAAIELEAKIARLTKELSEYDSRLHCERLLAKEQLQELLAASRQSQESKLDEERRNNEKEKEFLKHEIEKTHKMMEKMLKEKDDIVLKMASDIQDLEARSKSSLEKLYREKEILHKEKEDALNEQKEFLSNLRGNVGKVGENFVQAIHSGLELGHWVNTSQNQAAGCADALWEYDAGGRKLQALVEIKLMVALHNQKDIAKFWNDVDSGIRMGKINAAVFISIKARIPNTKPLQITMYGGIPILQVSRDAEDALPPASMVQLGLLALAQAWPLLNRHDNKKSEGIIEAVVGQYENQLQEIQKFSKRIEDLEKTANNLHRQASALSKIRDAMATSIENTRITYPQLCSETVELALKPDDQWHSDLAQLFLETIRSWKDSKGRYPKALRDLDLDENVLEFASKIPNALDEAVKRVKITVVPKKRARTTGNEEADE